jgi:hypothetical protein
MLLTSLSRMPFQTGPPNGEEVEEETEDEGFHAKSEIKNMVLGERTGDLNKIRESRRITSGVTRGADGEEDEEDRGDEAAQGAEVVREVEREVEREAERANDPEKEGG